MAGEASRENGKKGGRKKGSAGTHTLAAAEARARLIQNIHDNMDELFEIWMTTCRGYYQEKTIFGKQTIVYKVPPNPNAIRDIMDRAMGRPTQPIEAKVETQVDLSKRAREVLGQLKPLHDESGSAHSDVDDDGGEGDPGGTT